MATLQPMVCLLLASCLVLLGGCLAQYPGHYHGAYPFYPYRSYPSYPYGGWPLKPLHGVHEPLHRFHVHYLPAPYHPYTPKHDGQHQQYPHDLLPRPVPQPHVLPKPAAHPQFNVYNIFDGGVTKQSATAHAGANSPAGSSLMQMAGGEASQEASLFSAEGSGSGELRASSAAAKPPAGSGSGSVQATSGEASQEASIFSRVKSAERRAAAAEAAAPKPAPADDHATSKLTATPGAKHVEHKKGATALPAAHSSKLHLTFGKAQKAAPAPSHGAKKHVAAAPAFSNHGWFPHEGKHV